MRDGNSDSNTGMNRRDILKAAGLAGATALTSGAAANRFDEGTYVQERGSPDAMDRDAARTITIRSSDRSDYSFGVTGLLTPVDAPEETVSLGTASATLQDETHKFRFSGEFTELSVDGDATVLVDGEQFDVGAFPEKTLTIKTPTVTKVDISASGRIEAESGNFNRPNNRTVQGTVRRSARFRYTGQLTHFDIDGEATIIKNGSEVDENSVLPSTLPGEVTISGSAEGYTIRTSDTAEIVNGLTASVTDGDISGRVGEERITARYNGSLQQVEHDNGATAEIRPSSRRLVCQAPDDSSVEFTTAASEAVLGQSGALNSISLTVEAGETRRVKYYGTITNIGIADLSVSFDDSAYHDAAEAASLQTAAEIERTEEYSAVASQADGRVRHDVAGIYLAMSATPETPEEVVQFRMTDVQAGDEGFLSFKRARATGEILNAAYETHTHDDVGSPETIEMNRLQLSGRRVTPTAAAFETTTVDRSDVVSDAPVVGGRTSSPVRTDEEIERVDTSGTEPQWAGPTPEATESDISAECIGPVPCPSPPSIGDILDFFGDALDSFADKIGIDAEDLADAIASTCEAISDVDKEDFAITAAEELVIDTILAFQGLIDEVQQKVNKSVKVIWNMKLLGIDGLVSLATSGALDELNNGDPDCGACMAVMVLLREAGIYGTTLAASTICGVLSLTVLLGVLCVTILGTVVSLAINAGLPEVEEICTSNTTPTSLDPC